MCSGNARKCKTISSAMITSSGDYVSKCFDHFSKIHKHADDISASVCSPLLFGTRAYLFSPEEGSCYVFRPETIFASFLLSMVLLPKVLFNHS